MDGSITRLSSESVRSENTGGLHNALMWSAGWNGADRTVLLTIACG